MSSSEGHVEYMFLTWYLTYLPRTYLTYLTVKGISNGM